MTDSKNPPPPSSRSSKERPHYIAFLKYPDGVRRSLSTTNAVEAINKQLEILRRNSGGYFHSEETAKLKLGIVVTSLESGKWHRVAATVRAALDQFNAMFETTSRRNDARGHNIIDK